MIKIIISFGCVFITSVLCGQVICDGKQVVLTNYGTCNYNPYVLVFEDSFDGNSLDLTKWSPITGVVRDPYHNVEQQWYTPENIEVSNGTLKLFAQTETLNNQCFDIWIPGVGMQTLCQDFSYTSAEIDSRYKFSHGKFEIRCKIPKGKGFFPAFWTFGGPGWNEIDVFEFWNEKDIWGNYDPSKLSKVHKMNAHYDYDGDGVSYNCPSKYTGPDFSQAFHTFTLIWTPHKIEWYVDGEFKRINYLFYTVLGQSGVGCNTIQPFHQYIRDKAFPMEPMNIIANLAIQSGSNSPDGDTPFPSALEIDYIRYYKQMSCEGSLSSTDVSSLNLSSEIYNVIIGTTIDLSGNFNLESGQQLEVIARDEIILEPGFTAPTGSNFVARIDDGICAGVKNSTGENPHNSIATIDQHERSGEMGYNSERDMISVNECKDCTVKVFPNPSKGQITIEFTTSTIAKYELYLMDTNGRIIFYETPVENQNFEIDMSSYSSGIYLLNIVNTLDKKKYFHKVIKE